MTGLVQTATEILKRLPATQETIKSVCVFLPPAPQNALLAKVGIELVSVRDPECDLDFVGCAANKTEGGFRSPHSGKVVPSGEEGVELSQALRKLEIYANSLFREYVQAYYTSAVSSAYFFHSSDKSGFSAVFAILKESSKKSKRGRIACLHQVEMSREGSEKKLYQVTSKMMFALQLDTAQSELTGSLGTYKEEKQPAGERNTETEALHLVRLIEDNEIALRQQLEAFVASRVPGVQSSLYSRRLASEIGAFKNLHDSLMSQLMESGFKMRESDS